MNIELMKAKLDSTEYEFLENEKALGNNIMLLTTGGSYAYGTNIETENHVSDFDVRGIYLNSKEELLTMNCSDKPYENKDLDVVIYPIKQAVDLFINANPNTLEMLGTKDKHVFKISEEGKMLRDNYNLFLSKRVYSSFGGYAICQLRRLQNALARDSYPREEKEIHIKRSIEKQMLTFNDRYKKLSNEDLILNVGKYNERLDSEILITMNLKNYPLRDLKGMLSEMTQVLKDYDKLNHRNSKKDEIHLRKHAMHLVRLLLMGKEILEGKGINTYRENDREMLLDIRAGKYSYEEIFDLVNELENNFKYAAKHTNLPDKPNLKDINELVMEINKKVVMRNDGI
ncbi:Predicted nucleotidyltransferase [Clostridium cavendishii DSM 21758]|uniref:Predicted nucleotidyltransferase n=1 Tax=Clostridium cavendishii DSM 21758 TaxID=1121302 RepID=A0A1M6EZ24_9CLOT|nr:nucleotidyltransferase domain-containing protein [Clostridium cavendishii]SHI90703.1 Predicted nucleotidyltransferase [Clostridium cavendishii DSM 21758]